MDKENSMKRKKKMRKVTCTPSQHRMPYSPYQIFQNIKKINLQFRQLVLPKKAPTM